MKKLLLTILLISLFSYTSLAYDVFISTDKYTYSANENVFSFADVKINTTSISNTSVVLSAINESGSQVFSNTFITNSTGNINYTFTLSSKGNYTLRANVSGDYVEHFIKVLSYSKILMFTNKPSYTAGSTGTLTVYVKNINDVGVSGETISATIRNYNGSIINNSISACTTDSAGLCNIDFVAPNDDGAYIVEINNYEQSVSFGVGGFDAFMKVTPSIVGKGQNVTVRVIVKNANGNGITASTRQLVVTSSNGTVQTTITSMNSVNDSSGTALTGVYEDSIVANDEGTYTVKVTVQPQGSNITRELKGSFDVRSYLIDISSWSGSSVFTPGQTASLAVSLKNATSNEFMSTSQCGSGSCTNSLSSSVIYDPSDVATGYTLSVSEQSSSNLYRVDFNIPSGAKSGTYKFFVSFTDQYGTASGIGYFSVQPAKGSVRAIDQYPNGVSKETFLPGKQIVLEFSASNATGAVNITSINSYSIQDSFGNDKTSLFGVGVNFSVNNNKSYVNISAPKFGGRYSVRAKMNTTLGSVNAEGLFFVDVLDVEIRPQSIGGGSSSYTPFGGPGYMFAFRPNDTVQLRVTVKTASEKRGFEGFMGESFSKGGSAGGGHSVGFGGMFGIGGGSFVEGAQIVIDRIININTEEDATSSTTVTNCITDSTGMCTVSLKSNINGQNWTGGLYMIFANITTSDNQTDKGEGFIEIRKYYVNLQTRSAVAKNATSAGFTSFSDWFIGSDDSINVSASIVEPGIWQTFSRSGNLTIQGVYYTGTIGEYIYPPKLQSGTTQTANITNGIASLVISPPSGGWKSGYYIIKAIANISGSLDTGESFLMVKIYQGFGESVNPTTNQQDFTVRATENVSIRINIFDVKLNAPAANLTVTLNKILSFDTFPPGELTYDKTAVSTGTTDNNGQALMKLSVPTNGWSDGNYLVNFDVSNGTVTDTVQGFFQVKNFFVEMSSSKWRYATNETVSFNVTVSSDPSWMRQSFGGGCPAGDPMCSSGSKIGGPNASSGGGGGSSIPGSGSPDSTTVSFVLIDFGTGYDLDNDGIKDINITSISTPHSFYNITGNLKTVNTTNTSKLGIAQNFWCADTRYCQTSPESLGGNITNGFDSVDCGPSGQVYSNATSHNMSGKSYFCVNASTGNIYKIGIDYVRNETSAYIQYTKHVSGGIAGVGPVNTSGTQGFEYYNATLKSIKIVKFDFDTGETILRPIVDYNVTSATGSTIGEGKIVIPGIGLFKIQPVSTWSSGFYRVIVEFNTTPTSTSKGESGFSIETFYASCYRSSWGAVASGTNISITCQINNPADNGNYTSFVDLQVESVRNTFTMQDISSGSLTWTSSRNSSKSTANIALSQNLPNGQYEAKIKINSSSSDVKRQSVWFEIKDFEPTFYSEKWGYGSSETVSFRTYGILNSQNIEVNLSNSELIVYRYDKSTWAKSVVTGVTVKTTMNQTLNFWQTGITFINLSKSGGWDEGNYEVVANLTRVNSQGTPTGSKVEVKGWFDVRLFDAWGWSEQWSNHPKNNIILKVHLGTSGSWNQNYNGRVSANISSIKNTISGVILESGTDYSATNMTSNPFLTGDIILNITPLRGGLPVGTYSATVKILDAATGKTVTTDVWFEVKAFQFWASSERYEYSSDDDIVIKLNIYASGDSNITLSNAVIKYISKCTSTTCATITTSSLNTLFNSTKNTLTILNSSNLGTGYYSTEIVVNDTQNANASSWTGFNIKGFGVSGFAEKPSTTRYSYYINESIALNITGTIGTNITNVSIEYWDCSGTCTYNAYNVNVGSVLQNKTQIIKINPIGLNNTWITSKYGYASYTLRVFAQKSDETSNFYTYVYIQFPYIWNVSSAYKSKPTSNVTINVTVYIDDNRTQRLSNAKVNITRVLISSTWNDMNSTSGLWNHTGNITNSNGVASVIAIPDVNRFNWTVGYAVFEFIVTYGNASTYGYRSINIAQNTLPITSKTLTQNKLNINNATKGIPFNLSIILSNSVYSNADSEPVTFDVIVSNNALNSSSIVTNLTPLEITGVSIGTNSFAKYNFTMNSTGSTNVTSTITITPSTQGYTKSTTTYTFKVN